ncbi:phage tail tube protein [Arthrobacter sp. B1805]|uniref:phage tail tube protein n=1 Tax=Arthrobacter sp. B1805 TaxID=2058892 RepID=UPI000CE2C4A9|nr:phage tail tube protein [Arthrobacter sp. B1805]
MNTQLDCSIGLKEETGYGTAVVPDRFTEFVSESLAWTPEFKQGAGLRLGSRVPRASRRALVKQSAGGDIELEMTTKGMGLFLKALFGNSTSTAIGASGAFQQVHTLTTTSPLPSYTIQKGTPLLHGEVSATTFLGAMCASAELSASNADIVKLKTSWSAREIKTDTAYAPPSYAVDGDLLTFVHGAIRIGGDVTPPTATALADGGADAANITEFSLTIDNKLDEGGFTFGGQGKRNRRQAVGLAEVKGKITAEYSSNVLRDAYLNQLPLTLVMTFETPTDIAPGVKAALQIFLPVIKLEGEVPKSNGGEVITQSIDFTGLDPALAGVAPVYAVYRTTDTDI